MRISLTKLDVVSLSIVFPTQFTFFFLYLEDSSKVHKRTSLCFFFFTPVMRFYVTRPIFIKGFSSISFHFFFLFIHSSFLTYLIKSIMVNVPIAPVNNETAGVFVQELAPIGGSLVGSFFVGLIPLLLVLVLLGVFKTPAHYASFAGLVCW